MTKPKFDLSNLGGRPMRAAAAPLVALAVAALALAPNSDAQSLSEAFSDETIGGLMGACRPVSQAGQGRVRLTPEEVDRYALCIGYAMGQMDLIRASSKSICIPSRVTYAQGMLIFLEWADRNPSMHHHARPYGLGAALESAFPCN